MGKNGSFSLHLSRTLALASHRRAGEAQDPVRRAFQPLRAGLAEIHSVPAYFGIQAAGRSTLPMSLMAGAHGFGDSDGGGWEMGGVSRHRPTSAFAEIGGNYDDLLRGSWGRRSGAGALIVKLGRISLALRIQSYAAPTEHVSRRLRGRIGPLGRRA